MNGKHRMMCYIAFIFFLAFIVCRKSDDLTSTRVTENVYMLSGLEWDVNIPFIITERNVLVVDSGNNPEEGEAIVAAIQKITDKPIQYVVLTHYHRDHTLGLKSFPADAKVISHENCAQNIRKLNADRFKENVVYPDVTFSQQRMRLFTGEDIIELIYPGNCHTSGNIVVYSVAKKVLIMGDMLFHDYIPYIDIEAGANTQHWIDVLDEFYTLDVEFVIPGHGKLTNKDGLKKQKQYLSDLRIAVQKAIDDEASLEEAKTQIKMAAYDHFGWFYDLPGNIEAVYTELKVD